MTTEMKRADLEAEIMRRVKAHSKCGSVEWITIQPVDHLPPATNWKLGAVQRSGPGIPAECNQHIVSVVDAMLTTHRLIRD